MEGSTMSEFRGRIALKEIDKKTQEIQVSNAEPWVQEMLAQSAPPQELTDLEAKAWAEKTRLTAQVRLEKVGSEYMVQGNLKASVPAPCSRCGDLFTAERDAEFQLFLVPTDARAKEAEYSDDPDYVFFKGHELNLGDVLSEQLVVQEPVAECPAQKSDGTCTLCHKNPQYMARQGHEDEATSPFAKLKVLKE